VDVTITGRQSLGAGQRDRAVLVHKTQAISNGGLFDLSLDDGGAKNAGSYRFEVHVEF
jgi:hypothetical protein